MEWLDRVEILASSLCISYEVKDKTREQVVCDLRCKNRSVNRPVNRDTGLEMPCCPVIDLLWV